MTELACKDFNSIVGKLRIIANRKALVAILWEKEKRKRPFFPQLNRDDFHPILNIAETELLEYLSHARQKFTVPFELIGTDFQINVWKALQQIPYGSTSSYKQIAENIGNPKSVRAVGGAIGKNPLSIIIPCHRVIGSNGTLTGFAGGLEVKTKLLEIEKI